MTSDSDQVLDSKRVTTSTVEKLGRWRSSNVVRGSVGVNRGRVNRGRAGGARALLAGTLPEGTLIARSLHTTVLLGCCRFGGTCPADHFSSAAAQFTAGEGAFGVVDANLDITGGRLRLGHGHITLHAIVIHT